ncbi:MAG: hypothetical protein ACTSRG_08130 [Candidatus Helarchaeota archaeon]
MNDVLKCASCNKEIKSYVGAEAEKRLAENPDVYFVYCKREGLENTVIVEKFLLCMCHGKWIHKKCRFKHYGNFFGISEDEAKIMFEKLHVDVISDLMRIVTKEGDIGRAFVMDLISNKVSKDRKFIKDEVSWKLYKAFRENYQNYRKLNKFENSRLKINLCNKVLSIKIN